MPPSLSGEIELIRDFYAALNRGDIPAMLRALDPDIERVEPPDFPCGGDPRQPPHRSRFRAGHRGQPPSALGPAKRAGARPTLRDALHDPSAPRSQGPARTGIPGVHRSACDGQVAPAARFRAEVHSIDVRPGGSHRMSFFNLNTGQGHSFGGTYVDVKPGELLRYTDTFDDPNLPGTMSVTVAFRAVALGGPVCTDLSITQEGVPDVIPAEMCYLGWQESLALLTALVEPEVR